MTFGLGACLWWGLQPVYFKVVASVPTLEVLAHRVVWSWVLLTLLLCLPGRGRSVIQALRHGRTLGTLVATTCLIASSWYFFIWAVTHGHVLQASLGYFISPLINVLLGRVFLGERLRRWQLTSVLLAAGGVGYLTIHHGQVPTLALVLALSFSLYAMLRKSTNVDARAGLTIETTMLLPFALLYLAHLSAEGELVFASTSRSLDALLALAGVITAVPLLLFVSAARRLRLTTVGFLNYIVPSMHFLLAVIAFDEAFTQVHMISFGCIWTALAVYSLTSRRNF
ncbi:MAG: EamA family transporter RarD [Phycisphaerales bacterium]|nr:MAG: EamA family transporter RarD [Phycisphaerales bacterium]